MQTRPAYKEALAKWFNPKYLPLMDEKGSEAWPRVCELLAALRAVSKNGRGRKAGLPEE